MIGWLILPLKRAMSYFVGVQRLKTEVAPNIKNVDVSRSPHVPFDFWIGEPIPGHEYHSGDRFGRGRDLSFKDKDKAPINSVENLLERHKNWREEYSKHNEWKTHIFLEGEVKNAMQDALSTLEHLAQKYAVNESTTDGLRVEATLSNTDSLVIKPTHTKKKTKKPAPKKIKKLNKRAPK
jgi:hypothetical protein